MSKLVDKKRPPKLNLNGHQAISIPEIGVSLPTAGTTPQIDLNKPISVCSSNDLDSFVRVQIGDDADIHISPDSLTVVEQLGRGQYGIVERVHHKESDHSFAVKRVALKPGDTKEQTRLLMDVDILVKGTECKNIIKFYGALIWEGDLWILMELMDCSLHKFYLLAHNRSQHLTLTMQENRKQPKVPPPPCSHLSETIKLGNCTHCNPIPENILGRIAADIVNALKYLYSIKVIHRDIKPSNILINKLGIIKLCDFGISGYLVNSVARTYEAGCRPYMAPERIDPPRDSTGYDIKSDVWSFGITMLEIATGFYPYHDSRDFFKQLKAICADDPPKLSKGRFTAVFEDFIAQCLHKNYKLRPKYDVLESHEFLIKHKDLDIKDFTERILS